MNLVQSPGVEAFKESLASNRIRLSLSFQGASGGIREWYGSHAALLNAALAQAAAVGAAVEDRVLCEIELERWNAYQKVHSAVALQGVMLLFNTIDLLLKEYSQLQHGSNRWLVGGNVYSASGVVAAGVVASAPTVSQLELIRALCNCFRHRDEWARAKKPDKRQVDNISKLQAAGLNPAHELVFSDAFQLMNYDTWLAFESDLVTAISALP